MPLESRFTLPGISGAQLVDILRLEVETDPDGLANLIDNPDGSLGGYGWVATVGGTVVRSATTNGPAVEFVTAASGAVHYETELLPVTAGHYIAARWLDKGYTGPASGGYVRVRFEFYNAAGALLSSSTQSGYFLVGSSVRAYGPILIPASTTRARLRYDMYANTSGTAPSGGSGAYRVTDVTVATATTSAALGTTRTNLVTNPAAGTNTAGWTTEKATVTRTGGSRFMLEKNAEAGGMAMRETVTTRAVVAQTSYYASVDIAQWTPTWTTFVVRITLQVQCWNSATPTDVTYLTAQQVDLAGMTDFLYGYVTIPAGCNRAALRLHVTAAPGEDPLTAGDFLEIDNFFLEKVTGGLTGPRPGFDGATVDGGGWVYDWTGTAHGSTSTAVATELDYLPPVPVVDVLGPTHEIKVTRGALDPGTLTAEILDATLDPSQDDLIRPGRTVRLSALDAAGEWRRLFTGTLDDAVVEYHLLEDIDDNKRARITLRGYDNISELAAAKRPDSVATIAELPVVLEGAGVPWNVNGSGAQVGAAVVRASDTNATALDQVAMTRDTVHGYAWVDKENVLQVWDAASLDATVVLDMDEDVYSAPVIGFDTGACINELTITHRSTNAVGETVETVTTWTDDASVDEWGRHPGAATILAPADASTFAAEVFDTNATPQVRISSVSVPIRDETFLPAGHLELYATVQLANADKGIDQPARVTSIVHEFTPDRWMSEFGFSAPDSVASPQVVPPLGVTPAGVPHIDMMKSASTFSVPNSAWTTPTGWDVQTGSVGITAAGSACTIAMAGTYLITGQLTFAPSSTASRRQARLTKDGAMIARTEASSSIAGSGAAVSLPVHTITAVEAGDVIALQAWQNSGAALNVEAAEACFLRIYRIGD